MIQEYRSHLYWIIAGLLSVIAVLFIYPYSSYNGINMEISRTDAVEIAKDFLTKQKINLFDYLNEGYLESNTVANSYLQRTMSGAEFSELVNKENWPSYGWEIIFYKNLSRDVPQTTYTIRVSHRGKIISYSRSIPDTSYLPSLSKEEGLEFITSVVKKNLGIDLTDFNLAESREENLSKRTDYIFRWEKDVEGIDGKLVINAGLQGNQPGRYSYSFSPPQGEQRLFEASEALFGTISVIFIFFLTQFAIFLFLKKYHQGEIWISMGKNLFILFFLVALIGLVNMWPSIGQQVNIGSVSLLMVKIIVMISTGLIVYFVAAILLFTSWSVGESYGREFWPQKLQGIDAFIKRHIFSVQSGNSLFKGFILGIIFALVYLIINVIFNQSPGSIFVSGMRSMEVYQGFIPIITIFTSSFKTALLSSIVVSFFIINISYQRWKKKWISIFLSGIVATLGIVISANPPSIQNFILDMLLAFISGCIFAYIYFLFDLLVLASLHFHTAIFLSAFALFGGETEFYSINFYLLILIILIVPTIYIISRIKKQEFILENYGLPSHIERITEREKLKKELEIAAKVQLSLLPKEQPRVEGYDIASLSIPAREAGGDYYDFVKLDDKKLGIAIGDVSGKGVGAAIYMTLTKGILQAHAEENVSPKQVLGKVNRLLYKTIEKNSFVSMFYAILDIEKHTLLYSRAGHNPAILYHAEDGDTKFLLSKGIALGLEEGSIFKNTLTEETINLSSDDVVVLYTDGFTEAMNEKLEQYGEEKLKKIIEEHRDKSSSLLLNIILKDVARFTDNYPQHDDMTIVILKRVL